MNSSQAAVGGVSSSCLCLVVCMLAACAIFFLLFRDKGSDDTIMGDANPLLKDVVGRGEVMSAAGVERIVKAAAGSASPASLASTIRAQKGTAVRRSDLVPAMLRLSMTQQTAAVKAFMALQADDEAVVNVGLATMAYLMESAPKAVYVDTSVTCPTGYEPCSNRKFNEFKGQNAVDAFKKQGMVANQLCCKYLNAAGDPRPSCKKKVRKARKTFEIIMMVLELTLSLIPIPGVSQAGAAVRAGVTAVSKSLMKFTGAAKAFAYAGSKLPGAAVKGATYTGRKLGAGAGWLVDMGAQAVITAPLDWGIIYPVMSDITHRIVDSQSNPMVPCQACKEDFFNGDPADSFVLKKYKTEQGDEQWGAWQTNNGCPVHFGLPELMEYETALSDALAQAMGPDGYNLNDADFKDAANTNECSKGGCMKLPAFEDWLLANKAPINCQLRCRQKEPRGECTLSCIPGGAKPGYTYTYCKRVRNEQTGQIEERCETVPR